MRDLLPILFFCPGLLACVSQAPWLPPDTSGWTAVEVGWRDSACALHAEGDVRCWGEPSGWHYGEHVALAAGESSWFLSDGGQITGRSGTLDSPVSFVRISASSWVYGSTAEGQIWGTSWNELSPLDLPWPALAYDNGYALDLSGALHNDGEDPPNTLGEGYLSVSTSEGPVVCALHESGRADCWEHSVPATGAQGPFTHLDVGGVWWNPPLACGVRVDGGVECWGPLEYEPEYQPLPDGETYSQVSVGGQALCGLTTSGTLECGKNAVDRCWLPPCGDP